MPEIGKTASFHLSSLHSPIGCRRWREFAAKKRATKRDRFLAEMEKVITWQEVLVVIEPHYPEGRRGRPSAGLERMRRVYPVPQGYGSSDEGVEDAITDSQTLRGFVGIDLSREAVPDATTLRQFRHLLEERGFDEDRVPGCRLGPFLRRLESVKASIRSKVEHPFHIVKNLFAHREVRYQGLKKNIAQRHILFALANLAIAKRPLPAKVRPE